MSTDYNNRPIKIDFPRKMEIKSPELDAVKKSTGTIVNILNNHLKVIVSSLQALQHLPRLFTELKDLVANQFNNLFVSQMESNILNRQANIKMLGKKIAYIGKHCDKKEDQLKKTNDKVVERFKSKSEDMTKEHEFFLQKLDSHVFDITDKIYPKQVKERFSFDAQPNIDYLTSHAKESAFVRTMCINYSFKAAHQKVQNFIDERNIFYQQLSEMGINTELNDGVFELPFWYVDVEDIETGEVERKVFYPWGERDPESNSQTRKIIEEIAADHIESTMCSVSTNEQLMNELISDLVQKGIPNSEINRFQSDCQTVYMED